MASTEILKLLAPATTHHCVVGGHCHDSITSADVAAMTAGASDAAALVGYAKHARDFSSTVRLACHVYCWAIEQANMQNWKIVKGRPIVRNMSHLAVAEFIYPNVCCKCSGRGFVAAKYCLSCNGSGHRSMSDRTRAKEIGVDQSGYCRTWRDRYEYIYSYVIELESQLYQALRRSQREHYTTASKNKQLQAHQKQGINSQNRELTPQSLVDDSTGLFLCSQDHAQIS